MRYVSLFSGIEAATVAWEPLGWTPVAFAEIEKYPCKVLSHHYPNVPNLGDVTKITEFDIMMLGHVDVCIFGSPCQDLSVAGKRKGLAGERSGLFHDAMRIVRWLREHCGLRFALWENVPGAFSSNAGADFAVVVGEMAGLDDVAVPPKGWGNEGACVGQEGMVEWSTLDAQWFGVAQRRRRVFALADFGDWTRRPPVLLEPDRMRGDSAPCRDAGKGLARAVAAGAGSDGREGLLGLTPPAVRQFANGGIAGGNQRYDFETETLLPQSFAFKALGDYRSSSSSSTLKASGSDLGAGCESLIAYMPARSFGKDGGIDEFFAERDISDALHTASGSGNKAPLVTFAIQAGALRTNPNSGPDGVGVQTECAYTIESRAEVQVVGFSCKDYGADASNEVAPTTHAMGCGSSGGAASVAVAHSVRLANTSSNGWGVQEEVTHTLDCTAGPAVQRAMQVRRLTPRECERLQGFPDEYTAIPRAADGPRYKALGNSMAVPVINWIGRSLESSVLEFWA